MKYSKRAWIWQEIYIYVYILSDTLVKIGGTIIKIFWRLLSYQPFSLTTRSTILWHVSPSYWVQCSFGSETHAPHFIYIGFWSLCFQFILPTTARMFSEKKAWRSYFHVKMPVLAFYNAFKKQFHWPLTSHLSSTEMFAYSFYSPYFSQIHT